MKRAILHMVSTGLLLALITGLSEAAEEKLVVKQTTVSVTGRLSLLPRKTEDRLVLTGKDAKAYVILGDFIGPLKSTLAELGEKNLVTVTGITDNLYDVSCHTKQRIDPEGKPKVDAECLRYYHLTVTKINEAKISEEVMPTPERDATEELAARKSLLSRIHSQSFPRTPIMSVDAVIESVNVKSPVKTVKIKFSDKNGKPVTKDLMITADTRIGKKTPEASTAGQQPLYVDVNALVPGQQAHVEYTQDEAGTAQALFITILKE